jgi:hypothetical protein
VDAAAFSSGISIVGIVVIAAVGLVVIGGLAALLIYLLTRGDSQQPPDQD